MKVRKIIYTFVFLLMMMPAMAQKKEINTARNWIKSGKNFDKAEQSMMTLLNDSANRNNEKIWSVLFESLRKQYAAVNEKFYLKQKYDTVALFDIASRMFTVMASYDSIDAMPGKDGKINPQYRKDDSALLNSLRPNLYNRGLFFIRKQNFPTAYNFFDQYIETANQPLFAAYRYAEKDKHLPEAAYWAVYCAYKMKDTKKTLHHTYLALKDTAHYEMMLQYLAATYYQEGDTTRMLETLKEGFKRYPLSAFFYPHLIDHYSKKQQWNEILDLTNEALRKDSLNERFLLAKSSVLLNLGQYKASYQISQNLLARNDSLVEANLNAGLALFNQGVGIDKIAVKTASQRRDILKYYRQALPYIEMYRKRCPDRKDKWALPLYTIYLNLNMGKQFDEIDKILKQ